MAGKLTKYLFYSCHERGLNSNTNLRKRGFNMSDRRKSVVSQSFVWRQKRDDAAENDNIKT